ncbi:six-hairpin glycosidase [Aspergillus lucknowensis]|uniref:Six-hairpin glycosidase n=1 Tax=Aspergillus lucknowensis TaxID=176173 RepID=A0ABR4LYF0_9EURO
MKSVLAIALLARYVNGICDREEEWHESEVKAPYWFNDAWYTDKIPWFETNVRDIQDIYYYHWNLFRSHQHDISPDGTVTTEFLEDVPWQPDVRGVLPSAVHFHTRESRWSWDRRDWVEYVDSWFKEESDPYQFSESFADAVWQLYLVDGIADTAVKHLDDLIAIYEGWETGTSPNAGYDDAKGMFWIEPRTDGMEYSIASIDASGGSDGYKGGDAFRPSFNAYQYANARAISKLAALAGRPEADEYEAKAEALKAKVQEHLWNSTLEHFVDRYHADNENVKAWDFIRGRELVGYTPWAYDLPSDNDTFAQAWKHLLDPDRFAGEYGPRTTEPSYEHYMHQYRYDEATGKPERQWNGPSWPYQTTHVLTAMANLLNNYPVSTETAQLTNADYHKLLLQFAKLHPGTNDSRVLEENYDADTGKAVVGLPRSPHYFHSAFVDMVVTGFVGLRPRDDDVLEINPLADPELVDHFFLHFLPYHGRRIDIAWDRTGKEYYEGKGLTVWVDCDKVAHSDKLEHLTTNITQHIDTYDPRSKAPSVRLTEEQEYPRGRTSEADVDATAIHEVLDGKVWYFPEMTNGWQTPVGNGTEIWFEIDFGEATAIEDVEMNFAANEEQGTAPPINYKLRAELANGTWVNPTDLGPIPVDFGNGSQYDGWIGQKLIKRLRLLFTPREGKKVHLVEFWAYEKFGG